MHIFVSEMKKLKKIPEFKNEDEEREFWAKNDSSEYLDWDKSERMVLPNLKPSSKTISLRLPEYILDELKMLARKRDVPYQSLIKVYLKERVDQELNHLR
jgi:predicted DNA binding CopG/RHH family protein